MTPTLTKTEQKFCVTCGRPYKRTRSLNQNSYLWIIYGLIADETGDSAEKVHEICKEKFLPRMFVTVGDDERELEKTTTVLSTAQMETYLIQIRQWASEFLNLFLPLPNESL